MSVIFFDLDDTLYDRALPLIDALEGFFGKNGIADVNAAARACLDSSPALLIQAKQGLITHEQEIIGRYRIGLKTVGIEIADNDALCLHGLYTEAQKHIKLSDEILSCLNACREKYDRIGLITNGKARKQRGKIETLGLMKWVDPELVFVSEECGVLKPDRRIFEMAQKAADTNAENITMVGDIYKTDLKTPSEMGWCTVLLNRKKALDDVQHIVSAVVNNESELFEYLR